MTKEQKILISGFADEIDDDLSVQLRALKEIGMDYFCFRSANGKNIADYTAREMKAEVLPLLQDYGLKISSLGSPLGKVHLSDKAGVAKQNEQAKVIFELANILEVKYIRLFSFYAATDKEAQAMRNEVIERLGAWRDLAKAHGLILIHENEKEVYGDTLERNLDLMENLASDNFGLAFDFGNFVQTGEDTVECWQQLKDYVKYFHIKDATAESNENVVVGTGEGQVEKILVEAIKDYGYEGFLTLEPHLVLFASLASLELKAPEEVIKTDKADSGQEAFQMHYEALCKILEKHEINYF